MEEEKTSKRKKENKKKKIWHSCIHSIDFGTGLYAGINNDLERKQKGMQNTHN